MAIFKKSRSLPTVFTRSQFMNDRMCCKENLCLQNELNQSMQFRSKERDATNTGDSVFAGENVSLKKDNHDIDIITMMTLDR